MCVQGESYYGGKFRIILISKDQPVGIFIIKIDNLHQENSKLVSFALKWLVPTVKVFCLIIVQLLSQ